MTISTPPDPPQGYGKAVAAAVGGALSVIILSILNRYLPPPPLSQEVTGAIQTLITLACVYFVPHFWVGGK